METHLTAASKITSVAAPPENRERLTILHVHNSRIVGGVETSLVGWHRHLDENRFVSRLICFEEADGAERDFLEYLGRRNMTAQLLPWGKRKRVIAAVTQLIGMIRASRPCLVHTHDLRPDVIGWLAARATGCPLVASQHGWLSMWPGVGRKRRRNDALRARILKHFDAVIAVAESVREESVRRGIDGSRVTTLFTGLDLKDFSPSVDRNSTRDALGYGPSDLVIGNVARLHPEKGQILLIQAFARIREQIPQARLLIAGDGPLLEALRSEAVRLSVGERVKFLKFQDDIASLLAALDIFVLPSFAEGTPLIVYKAMASGLPIIASRLAGVSELLRDGESALLVPANDPGALVNAMLKMTSAGSSFRLSLGLRAQQDIRTDPRFSIVTSTRRLESLYARLASG